MKSRLTARTSRPGSAPSALSIRPILRQSSRSRLAMTDVRLRILLEGPLATPLYSPTLFGHLCWTLRTIQGDHWFSDWIHGLDRNPVVFSDAMPAGQVPVPLLDPERPSPSRRTTTPQSTEESQHMKKLARRL